MAFQVTGKGGYQIVELTGEVDLSRSPEARKTILDCLGGKHHVLVDLSAVSYIDSSGVASLVEGYQTAKKSGLEFGLISVSVPALAVLKLARLDKVFEIHESLAERAAEKGD